MRPDDNGSQSRADDGALGTPDAVDDRPVIDTYLAEASFGAEGETQYHDAPEAPEGDPASQSADDADWFFGSMYVLPQSEPPSLSRIATGAPSKGAPTDERDAHLPSARRKGDSIERPSSSPEAERPVTALIDIQGVKAYTLFDTGALLDVMSPEFARIAGVAVQSFSKPVPVQLGAKGSRSTLNGGARVDLRVGAAGGSGDRVFKNHYVDIMNIDRYDLILGTPFFYSTKGLPNVFSKTVEFPDFVVKGLSSAHDAQVSVNPKTARVPSVAHSRLVSWPSPTPSAPRLNAAFPRESPRRARLSVTRALLQGASAPPEEPVASQPNH